jgi:hypothetical protein
LIQSGGTIVYSQLTLNPTMDADGDGLRNGWEQQYGLDPFSPTGNSGAAADTDGDGMSNLQEFLTGTDPTNNASSFRVLTVVPQGNNLRVSWMTGIGKTNALQRSVTTGNFTNSFADIFIVTNTSSVVTNYLVSGAMTNWPANYYRVRLVQ